ncbi:MAG TPA: NAD(P)/FAD-dependent oxidoreductase [Bacteroidetes bacterium]|nr:NAD(P)/FAD-dependent oxidoreductase [Bacteroidota bacterium]
MTPAIFRALGTRASDYPYGILRYNALHFHLWGHHIPIPTRQYSIRRVEFDRWLLKRSGAPVEVHGVKQIEQTSDGFVIDGRFRCRHLVGAGGTYCPVYRTFFRDVYPRDPSRLIVTLEEEFPYSYRDGRCYLWFFDNDLPGYSWYVPKAGGVLNLGVGGKLQSMRERGQDIRQHWEFFLDGLRRRKLVGGDYQPSPRGYQYYLRHENPVVQRGNAYVVGDAAGVATLDMGEGIYPSVLSGLRAAEAILTGKPYTLDGVPKYSFPKIFFPF